MYYARGTAEGRGVYVGQLDGAHSKRLLEADAVAVYASTGHILFVRQGTLWATRFDLDRLEPVGNPLQVAQQAVVSAGISIAALSVSPAGPIIYRAGKIEARLIWTDRSGKAGEAIGDADGVYHAPSLSPNGRWIAVARNIDSIWNIVLIDGERGSSTRLTMDPPVGIYSVWAPDGSHIVYGSTSTRKGPNTDLYSIPAFGNGRGDLLLETPGEKTPTDWSSDPQFLLYHCQGQTTGYDLWALPMGGIKKPFPVVLSAFNQLNGQFSPKGKWVAYQSDESGRSEIYVQPFPGPGDKKQVSTAGGGQVRWRADEKELFYIALDGHLMAVPIRLPSNGGTIDIGRPVRLFPTHIRYGVLSKYGLQYAVARDGQRFLINTVTKEPLTISVILNWKPTK